MRIIQFEPSLAEIFALPSVIASVYVKMKQALRMKNGARNYYVDNDSHKLSKLLNKVAEIALKL